MDARAAGHLETPRVIRMHADDNVAIVANEFGLPAGAQLLLGPALREHVPQGHKVGLVDIAKGAPVRRYNVVIGYAAQALPAGSWINEHRLVMPTPPALEGLPIGTRNAPLAPPLEGFSFEGYRNSDGSVGTRNLLAITTTVQCVSGVVEHAVRRIRDELLPRYPNVDDVVGLEHIYGCGVAIDAPEAEIPIRTLRNISFNPKFWWRHDGRQPWLRETTARAFAARWHGARPRLCRLARLRSRHLARPVACRLRRYD